MLDLLRKVKEYDVKQGIAVCFLGQAGYLIRTVSDEFYALDPYLSNYCERKLGPSFKRLTPTVLDPQDLDALDLKGYFITHHHEDHLDVDTILNMKNTHLRFYTTPTSIDILQDMGINQELCYPLSKGTTQAVGSTTIHAVFADHGELAPDAVGIIIQVHGKIIYHMGDTCFNADELRKIKQQFPHIDLLIAPINGRFGNMNESDAVQAVSILEPKLVTPCHFWMLPANSGGNPEQFIQQVHLALGEQSRGVLLAPGDIISL